MSRKRPPSVDAPPSSDQFKRKRAQFFVSLNDREEVVLRSVAESLAISWDEDKNRVVKAVLLYGVMQLALRSELNRGTMLFNVKTAESQFKFLSTLDGEELTNGLLNIIDAYWEADDHVVPIPPPQRESIDIKDLAEKYGFELPKPPRLRSKKSGQSEGADA